MTNNNAIYRDRDLFVPLRARSGGWVRRGDARLLVLEVLKDGPMHGYEVGKAIAHLFGGVYEPSPGVVYPNLQWLEDEGMLKPAQQRGKKVYKITERGKKFAGERRGELTRLLEIGRDTSRGSKLALMREGKQLSRMLEFAFPELTEAKAKRVANILQDTRERVEEVMQQ